MELKVRKIGNGCGVLMPKQLLRDMGVREGSSIQVERGENGMFVMKPADDEFTKQVEAFLKTEPFHRNTYRELAK